MNFNNLLINSELPSELLINGELMTNPENDLNSTLVQLITNDELSSELVKQSPIDILSQLPFAYLSNEDSNLRKSTSDEILKLLDESEATGNLLLSDLKLIIMPFEIIFLTNLVELDCSNNRLFGLKSLPYSLKVLICIGNKLNYLVIPPNLEYLDCSENNISEFKFLPKSLTFLNCEVNRLKKLPTLPNLNILNCGDNSITHLPNLVNSCPNLEYLNCNNNLIKRLPKLPDNLLALNCKYNNLSKLPKLPPILIDLNCDNNHIKELPTIPTSLLSLSCSNNEIYSLPNLKNCNLYQLLCENNFISYAELPNSLEYLFATNNYIKTLYDMPINIKLCDVSNNLLESLPSINLECTIYFDNLMKIYPVFLAPLNHISPNTIQIINNFRFTYYTGKFGYRIFLYVLRKRREKRIHSCTDKNHANTIHFEEIAAKITMSSNRIHRLLENNDDFDTLYNELIN